MTSEGNIIVDGILASCYAGVNDHYVAHLGMMPMRRFSAAVEWLFGDDIGYSVFAKTAKDLNAYMLPTINVWKY